MARLAGDRPASGVDLDMVIDIECRSCNGTGLYVGFAEPKGIAVVCVACKGGGCERLTYTPFTARKPRTGITTVRRSAGTLIVTGVGPTGGSIPYEEFAKGKLP